MFFRLSHVGIHVCVRVCVDTSTRAERREGEKKRIFTHYLRGGGEKEEGEKKEWPAEKINNCGGGRGGGGAGHASLCEVEGKA